MAQAGAPELRNVQLSWKGWPALNYANYLGLERSRTHLPDQLWDTQEDILSGCLSAFCPRSQIIQVRVPTGNVYPGLDPSARTRCTLKLIKTTGWKELRVCEGEKQLLCLTPAPPVIWWHSSTGATVNVLLSQQRGELTECFCLPGRGLGTPPLSARPRRALLMRSWPYSITFSFPSTFFLSFLDVCLPFFVFFRASERCQARRGKERLWWCRLPVDALQTQGTLPIMYAHHALVRTHPHRHSNTLARANKSTFLRYLCKWKTKEFNAMSLTLLAPQARL